MVNQIKVAFYALCISEKRGMQLLVDKFQGLLGGLQL